MERCDGEEIRLNHVSHSGNFCKQRVVVVLNALLKQKQSAVIMISNASDVVRSMCNY